MVVNNKGYVGDIIIFAVLIFALGIGYFAFYNVFNDATDQLLNNSQVNSSNATVTVLNSAKATTDRLDYVIFAIFIGLVIGLFITGWVIGGRPIFMVLYFLFIVIAIILSAIMSNTWSDVGTIAGFTYTQASAFPITNHLLAYLPFYVAGAGFLGMFGMFMKPFLGGVG